MDDLGAIIIIALFYTNELQTNYLFAAAGIFALLIILNRLRVHQLLWYLLGGVIMWYCLLQSGVHATITGVLLAFAIPFGDGKESSPSWLLQHWLHIPVAFIIVPLFAFVNTGILFNTPIMAVLSSRNALAIIAGLVLGKPLGILLFSFLAVKLKLARIPEGVNWIHLTGAGLLAGIGFTMSIFITLLAFENPVFIQYSKIAILLSSLLAGCLGYFIIKLAIRNEKNNLADEG